jgi:hypothetical protein
MAKRKTARSASRTRTPGATRAVTGGRGTSSTARKTATSRPAAARKGPARASTAKKSGSRTSTAKRSGASKTLARKSASKTGTAASRSSTTSAANRPATARTGTPTGRGTRTLVAKRTATRPGGRPASDRSASASTPPRQDYGRRVAPDRLQQIERDRRIVEEEVPTPPSTLDLDRRPSAARTGRAEMEERLQEHTAAGPDVTAGDVDADWESAYNTGDEAPGGDMPTPDQTVVAEIGTAVGLEYADNEELKAVGKIEQRDRHRWELDPASSEDYEERARETKKA